MCGTQYFSGSYSPSTVAPSAPPHPSPSERNITESELQSSDSEDPDDSGNDAQSDSSEMGDFIEHSYEVPFAPDTAVECVTVQSKKRIQVYLPYLKVFFFFFFFFLGGGGGGVVIIIGRFGGEGVRVNLPFEMGGGGGIV